MMNILYRGSIELGMIKNRVAYSCKVLFSFVMLVVAYQMLTGLSVMIFRVHDLGYRSGWVTLLGVPLVLGVIALWQSTRPYLQDSAFGGFSVALTSVFVSHLLYEDGVLTSLSSVVLLAMLWAAWGLRPDMETGE